MFSGKRSYLCIIPRIISTNSGLYISVLETFTETGTIGYPFFFHVDIYLHVESHTYLSSSVIKPFFSKRGINSPGFINPFVG